MKNWPKVLLVFVQLGMVLFGVNSVNAQSISNLRVSGNPLGFCPGQSYTFLFDTLGPIGPSTFQIQVSNSSGSFSSPIASASGSSTSINLLIPNSASSGANYAFRVIRTSPSLLVSDTLKNKLISKPTPSFSFSPNAACPDNDVSFTNSSTGNGSLNYAWNFARTYTYGAPVASSIASPVVRFNPFYGGATVSYEVQLVVTDAYGCKDSTSQNVGVKQRPLAQLADSNIFSSPPFSNCQGSPSASNPQFRLTVDNQCQVQNTIASISINWGEGTPVSFPGTFLQTSYTYTTLGAYNLELTATNNNGCITTQSYAVSNQINPTLTLSGPANKQGCAPFVYPIVMNNHHSNSGGTYYVFDFDDGSPLLRIDTLGSDTIWHTFINNSCSKPGGAYIVKAKAYNLCDSTPASLGNFRIYAKPRAGFSLGSDTIICANSSIAPINTTQSAQYGLSCATTTNYQWTFTGGVPATSTASTPPSISYALPGNYPIRLIASNPCGNDTFIKTVCVQAAPTANFSFSQLPSSKCSESVLNLNNISSTLTQCLPGQFLWEVRDSASNTLINPGLKFIYLAGNADTLEPTLKFLKAGKYRLRLKVTNACGVHTKDSILTVKDIPKVVLPAPQTYCDTTQIEFNGLQSNHVANYDSSFGSLTAFAWTISPSSFAFVSGNASSKSPKIKLYGNGVSSQDYQIIHTAQNECGFSLADTQLVSINAQSHTIASATDTMICSGASTSISLSSSLPSGVTYTWRAFASSPNLSGYSNQTTGVSGPINQVLNLVGNSVEYVTYRIVAKHAATNCIGDSVDIRIYLQTPIGNNSISGSAAYCIGGVSPTQIGQVPIGGNGFYSFQWQKWNGSSWVNTGVSDTLKDYTPPYLVQTEFYRRQVTSGWCNGSLGSFSNIDTLLIYQKPIVNAGLDFYKCKNETNFKLQGIPAGGNWFGTHVYAGDSFNLTAASAGIYSLIYSYTNANSCSNSDTVNLRIFSFPTVNAGSDFSICEGPDSLLLTGFTPAGGTWLGLGITTTNYFKPAVTGAGLFNLVYQYNDTNGCVGRDTIQVRVFAKPNPNFALQTQYCPNDTQTLFSVHNFSSTIISYTWQVSNLGGFSNTILSSFSISNPLVTLPENQGNSDINYSLKLLVISADGCKDSITKNTFLRRRPDAQFSANGLGNCGPLTIGLSNATNNVSSRWQWTVLPNSGVLVQTDTSQNPSVFLPENLSSASINYQLKLIAFRNDLTLSCSDTNTQFNSLYPRPNADFSINPLDSGCGPFSASFINLSDPKNAESIASMSFNWDFGAKGNDTTKNASRVYTNTGIVDSVYEVKLIATSAWGCKDTVDKQVIVKPNAKASFSTGITVSCAPFSINSSAVIAQDFPAANGIYSWYANGVLLGTGITFPGYLLANPSDSVEIKLKVLSKNGCLADSVSQKYFTIENPRPNFYAVDSIACSGSSIDLINTSIPLSGLNYRWELGSSNTISTALNPQINVR
ncbi:MAG: PKD domain-containing protein, partial [Bacteroidia bacterium]|nr:PKD domain-containing protein [Bacteroidia bacterium]